MSANVLLLSIRTLTSFSFGPPLPWGYRLKQGDHGGLLHSFGEISGWRCFWRIGWRVKANQQRGPHQGALVITSSNFHGIPSLVTG